jgi:hypothetical protein
LRTGKEKSGGYIGKGREGKWENNLFMPYKLFTSTASSAFNCRYILRGKLIINVPALGLSFPSSISFDSAYHIFTGAISSHKSLLTYIEMATYKYIKLNQKNDDIRHIRLLPGHWEDEILFDIFHTPLLPPKYEVRPKRLSLEELQEGLPDGVSVKETLDGRYLFIHNGPYNSWDHPNPGFDRTLYELKPQKTLSEYKPIYEALSYTWGPMTKPVVLHVLGQVPTRLGIGINLATALKHLRHPDQPRTIWVDAICIN